MNVVLASSSPRRKKLLEQIHLSFEVCPSDVEEVFDDSLSPEEIVTELATKKGEDVAALKPNSLIIAADTIVCFDDQILGKPSTRNEAYTMLKQLSGNSHEVYTGVYVALTDDNDIARSFTVSEKTIVVFGTLSESEINGYIDTNAPYDKAGSYGIQDDLGCLFVERIEGDYYNVVGFPLFKFYRTLISMFPRETEQLFEFSKK